MAVELQLLGPLEVRIDGEPVGLGGHKQRTVIARLAVSRGEPITADGLIDATWGDDAPPSASATLSAYVSRLRKLLGTDTIRLTPHGYVLDTADMWVDADEFVRLADPAREHEDPADEAAALSAALDLWRGPFLADFEAEPWVLPVAAHHDELRHRALERRFTCLVDTGEHETVIPELEQALAHDPLRERLWEALMLALYRSGRQADALRTFQRAATVLRDELGIDPGEGLRRLEMAILLQHPDLVDTINADLAVDVANNLPARRSTPLGRAHDVDGVVELLDEHRLVTILGPGGVGKTTLALEVAAGSQQERPDGIWWVDLAPLTNGERVAETLGEAVGVHPELDYPVIEAVCERLTGDRALIVLDNCEHVLDVAERTVGTLLERCPDVVVLATSRKPLGLVGEMAVELAPLPVPGSDGDVRDNPAFELFVQRARAASPGFRLSSALAADVVEIVRLVDGIPLAIEIAAAQLPLHNLRQITDSLRSRLLELPIGDRPPRHATMGATIDWSWHALDDGAQEVFAGLAAFAGSFTVDAIDPILGRDAGEDLDALRRMSLVDGPLPSADGRERFRLLEPIKQYARTRVHDPEALALAHAATFVASSRRNLDALHGPEQIDAMARYAADAAEVVHAIDWLREHPEHIETLSDLVEATWYWLMQSGSTQIVLPVLQSLSDSERLSRAQRARHQAAAALAGSETGSSTAAELARSVIDAAEALGSDDAAWCRLLAGDALSAIGDYEAARAPLLAAADRYAAEGPDWAAGWAHLRLARAFGLAGDIATGDQHFDRALQHLERSGDDQLLAYAQLALGNRSRLLGSYEAGLAATRAALQRFVSLGQEQVADECRFLEARALLDLGRWEEAADVARDLRRHAERGHRPSSLAGALLLLGRAQMGLGRHDEARRIHRELAGDDVARAANTEHLALNARTDDVSMLLLDGDVGEAAAVLSTLDELAASPSPWERAHHAIAEARVALARGEVDDARRAAERALAAGPEETNVHAAVAARSILGLVGDDTEAQRSIVTKLISEFGPGLDPATRREVAQLLRG